MNPEPGCTQHRARALGFWIRLRRLAWLGTLAAMALAWGQPASAQALATLEGRVIDGHTGEALAGATVFLSGTQQGTVADTAGRFVLVVRGAGRFEVAASLLGYGTAAEHVVITPGERYQLQLALAAAPLALPGFTVEDDGRAWRRNLARFRKVFVGEVAHAGDVHLLNPEVLRFEPVGEALQAWAEAPLEIENRALGYHITYLLDRFETGPGDVRMRWDGRALFTELPAGTDRQRRAWAEARQRAFRGSFRHFLRTLAQGTTYDEGYRLSRSDSLEAPKRYAVSMATLVRAANASDIFGLQFRGMLHVYYEREDTSPRYLGVMAAQSGVARARDTGVRAASYVEGQASMLVLKEAVVMFHRSGLLIDPNAAEKYGYWAWEDRIANLLPYEYGME